MRYLKQTAAGAVEEYAGNPKLNTTMQAAGWLPYAGALPLSRLNIVDGAIVELPEPGPSVEQVAYETRDKLLSRAVMLAIPEDDDETALALAPVCPEWAPGETYLRGGIINHEDQAYRVMQSVDALEHQPPGSEGMLAVYRPLTPGHAGTPADPIPWIYGMDVTSGTYYRYDGTIWLAKSDMKPCVWAPGTPGLWQWEEVN